MFSSRRRRCPSPRRAAGTQWSRRAPRPTPALSFLPTLPIGRKRRGTRGRISGSARRLRTSPALRAAKGFCSGAPCAPLRSKGSYRRAYLRFFPVPRARRRAARRAICPHTAAPAISRAAPAPAAPARCRRAPRQACRPAACRRASDGRKNRPACARARAHAALAPRSRPARGNRAAARGRARPRRADGSFRAKARCRTRPPS